MGLTLVLTLAACGGQNSDSRFPEDVRSDGGDNKTTSSDITESTPGEKVLIAYFSATGNTKEAAEYIASVTGGDLFELVPENPYTAEDLNWNNENSRVVYEHEHPDERDVTLTAASVDNFGEYDAVFIGYPIWWGIAAWPVDGFIKANDFSGKTVIPFCTSASSGLGESGKLLSTAAGTGDWLDGRRFSSGVTEEDISEWLQSLGY